MDILIIALVVVIVLVVLGILLNRLSFEAGIKWIIVIVVLGLLIYFLFTKLA